MLVRVLEKNNNFAKGAISCQQSAVSLQQKAESRSLSAGRLAPLGGLVKAVQVVYDGENQKFLVTIERDEGVDYGAIAFT